MKKLTKILSALALIAGGFLFSSCGDSETLQEVRDILAPNDTWCKFKTTSDNKEESDGSKATYYFKFDKDTETFSIAVLPAPGSTLANTFNTAVKSAAASPTGYYQKDYVKGESASGSDTDEDKSLGFKMDQNTWLLFYQAKLEKAKSNEFPPKNSVAIDLSAAGENIQKVKESFSLKGILTLLIDYL